jgi:hypothetical protein
VVVRSPRPNVVKVFEIVNLGSLGVRVPHETPTV